VDDESSPQELLGGEGSDELDSAELKSFLSSSFCCCLNWKVRDDAMLRLYKNALTK
jgi:hypothetical protein